MDCESQSVSGEDRGAVEYCSGCVIDETCTPSMTSTLLVASADNELPTAETSALLDSENGGVPVLAPLVLPAEYDIGVDASNDDTETSAMLPASLTEPLPDTPPSPPPDYEYVMEQDLGEGRAGMNMSSHPSVSDYNLIASDYSLLVGESGKAGLLPHAFSMYDSILTMDNKSHMSFNDGASLNLNICRICHMPGEDGEEILISPCRCAGTLQFIHNTCLQKWLEITSKKSRKPPRCELCHFQYHRHKKFNFRHWRLPRISRQDLILHTIFMINLIIMVTCAIATVMCFLSDKGRISQKFQRDKVDLTTEEVVTLSCGVLFFVSFFIAMSVQIKAKHTIYQLFVKFIMQNMQWEIDEYDKEKDTLKPKSKIPV